MVALRTAQNNGGRVTDPPYPRDAPDEAHHWMRDGDDWLR